MADSRALPSVAYRDPSLLADTLRRIERQMQGCKKCRHHLTMIGLTGCVAGGKVDEDNYCAKFRVKAGDNKKGAA